jgi:predicted 3-demethylubiquinone-9 3-methyltransferase (glyoxalase superfamily)
MHWTIPALFLTLCTTLLCATAAQSPEGTPMKQQKVTPFLMFDDQLEAALKFYTATFPDSQVKELSRSGKDGPLNAAEFVVGGQRFMGFNGGPHFEFSEGFSLYVDCKDQAEVDLYWDKLVAAGATPTQCGWIKDPYGLSWQIIPRRFSELLRDKDPKKVKAVIDAMMKMKKLDVAALERAYAKA